VKRFLAEARAGAPATPKEWAFDSALMLAAVVLFTLNLWPTSYDDAPKHAPLIAAGTALTLMLVLWPFMWRDRARFEAEFVAAPVNSDIDHEGPVS
jgi:hypothetical protein